MLPSPWGKPGRADHCQRFVWDIGTLSKLGDLGSGEEFRLVVVLSFGYPLPSGFANVSFLVGEAPRVGLPEGLTHLVNCRCSLRNGFLRSFKEQEGIASAPDFCVGTVVLWQVEDPVGLRKARPKMGVWTPVVFKGFRTA